MADVVAVLDVVGHRGEKVAMLRVLRYDFLDEPIFSTYAIFEAVDCILNSLDSASLRRDPKILPRRAELIPGEVDVLAVEWGEMIL